MARRNWSDRIAAERLIPAAPRLIFMRSVILFPCLLVLGLALTLLLWPRAKPVPAPLALVQPAAGQPAERVERAKPLPWLVVAEPPVVTVAERVNELAELAMSDDSADLQKMLQVLTDADPAVRAAATEAVVQFGSQAALPALRSALAGCGDFHEAATLQAAINFLELPTVAEVAAK